MRLALFQPDNPQNTGAAMRLCAGFGVALDIIEPCGFPLDDARLKRVAMDYDIQVEARRHRSWEDFLSAKPPQSRLILLTTKGAVAHHEFVFQSDDILIAGRESAGVPDFVHETADARVVVPIVTRSFNVIVASGIVLAEGLRQVGLLPTLTPSSSRT